MKKVLIGVMAAIFLAGCTAEKRDTQGLTGIEAVSQDGSVTILLPDNTFMPSDEGSNHMDFDSEKGYIHTEWGDINIEEISGALPQNKSDVEALYTGVDADITVNDVSYDDKNGVKTYISSVSLKNYVEEGSEEPESFTVLEYVASYEDKYYYATADVYDEESEDIILKSLKTFGSTK